MSKADNRSQMMARLGAVQLNTVWSWCALNEEEKKVYFSAWLDYKRTLGGRVCYLLQEPHWGHDESSGSYSPARNDQEEKLRLVFDQGYEAFLYFIEAEDPTVVPRSIKSIRTSFVFSAELERRQNGDVVAYPTGRVEVG